MRWSHHHGGAEAGVRQLRLPVQKVWRIQRPHTVSPRIVIQDYDIVADRQEDDRFTIRRWIRGELKTIDAYDGTYTESEKLQRLAELGLSGTTWIRDSPVAEPNKFRLVE